LCSASLPNGAQVRVALDRGEFFQRVCESGLGAGECLRDVAAGVLAHGGVVEGVDALAGAFPDGGGVAGSLCHGSLSVSRVLRANLAILANVATLATIA